MAVLIQLNSQLQQKQWTFNNLEDARFIKIFKQNKIFTSSWNDINNNSLQKLDEFSLQQLKKITNVNTIMKPIELQNNQFQSQQNYQQIQFNEIFFGFASSGLLYQTSTNASYIKYQEGLNCSSVAYYPDVRCLYWFAETANQQYLKILPPYLIQNSSNLSYQATLFCKKNQLENLDFFVACQSINLTNFYNFFKIKTTFSYSQLIFDADVKEMIYNSQLLDNNNYFLDDFCTKNINQCLMKNLDATQANQTIQIIDILRQNQLISTQEIKSQIDLWETLNQSQQNIMFDMEGDQNHLIVNYVKVVDKLQTDSQITQYSIQTVYLFIDTQSKNQFQNTIQKLCDKLKQYNFYFNLFIYLIFLVITIQSVALLYYSFFMQRLIDYPIEHLTKVLKQLSLEDNRHSLNKKRTLSDQDFIQNFEFEKYYLSETNLESFFSAKETKILFLTFQNLFKTLNFTLQNYYEQNDNGCSTLLQLNQQVEHFSKFSNTRALGVLYNNMGNIHFNNERHIEAMECYQQSIIFSNYELQFYKEKQINRKTKRNTTQTKKFRQQNIQCDLQEKKLEQTKLNSKEHDKIFLSNTTQYPKLSQQEQSQQKSKNILITQMNQTNSNNINQGDETNKIKMQGQVNQKIFQIAEKQKNISFQQHFYDQVNKNLNHLKLSQLQKNEQEKKRDIQSSVDDVSKLNIKNERQFKRQFKQKIKNKYQLYWKLFNRKFNFTKALITYSNKQQMNQFLSDGIIMHFEDLLEINRKYLNNQSQVTFIVNFYYTNFLSLTGEVQLAKQRIIQSFKQYQQITNSFLLLLGPEGIQNDMGQKTKDSFSYLQTNIFESDFKKKQNTQKEKQYSTHSYLGQINSLSQENDKLQSNQTKQYIDQQQKFNNNAFKSDLNKQNLQQSYLNNFEDIYLNLERYYDLMKQLNFNKSNFHRQSVVDKIQIQTSKSQNFKNQEISFNQNYQNSQNSLLSSTSQFNLTCLKMHLASDNNNISGIYLNNNNNNKTSFCIQGNIFNQSCQQNNQQKYINSNSQQSNKTIKQKQFTDYNKQLKSQSQFLVNVKQSQLYMEYNLYHLSKFIYTPDIMCGLLIFSQTLILLQEKKIIQSLEIMTDYLEKLKFVQRQVRYHLLDFLFKIGNSIPLLKSPILELKVVYDFKITFSVVVVSACQNQNLQQQSRKLIDLFIKEILTFDSDQFCLIYFDKFFSEVISISQMLQIKQQWQKYQYFLNQFLPQYDFASKSQQNNLQQQKLQVNFSQTDNNYDDNNLTFLNQSNQILNKHHYGIQNNLNYFNKNQKNANQIKMNNLKNSQINIRNFSEQNLTQDLKSEQSDFKKEAEQSKIQHYQQNDASPIQFKYLEFKDEQYYLQKKCVKSKKFVDEKQHVSFVQRLMNKKYFVYILQDEVDSQDNKFELMCEELYSLGIELLILQLNKIQSLQEQKVSQHYFKDQIVVRYFYDENKIAEYIYNQRETYKFRQFPLIYEQY
ncbi:hypothetical protein ABPG74_020449 [Tetrahymena malaccensis]